MICLDHIQNKPVVQLSLAEIRLLPDEDQSRALSMLFEMARDGDLAMLIANPPGTTYEVVFDRARGWALRPVCRCNSQPRFVEAYLEWNDVGQSTTAEK